MQGDLLVDVLEEVQDAREVVVDHEILDSVEEDDGARSLVHEVRDQVAQAVQIVRIDVILAQRRREPDDADFLLPPTPDDVVRVLARDVHRAPAGIDRPLKRREGLLRLLLLHQVGASFLEVLLLAEEEVLEKLVLLEGEQERPREPPHWNRVAIRRSVFIRILSTIAPETYCGRLVARSESPLRVPPNRPNRRVGDGSFIARWLLVRLPWGRPSLESSEVPRSGMRSNSRTNRRSSSSRRTARPAIPRAWENAAR